MTTEPLLLMLATISAGFCFGIGFGLAMLTLGYLAEWWKGRD